tara:strand:+ start:1616 stop:1918 length:303 start_codon:yes stop_codon:yes gene_type:complete
MIDTNKYEGHIPGPWKLRGKIRIDKEYIATNLLHTIDTQPSKCGCTDVNAQLIADAPLLLAEVKRLRKRNDWLCWAIADITKGMDEDWRNWQRTLKEWIE